MIQITEAAKRKINQSLEKYREKQLEYFVRLNMGIGWGGPQLELTLEESALENDESIEVEGIKFLIAHSKKPYFNETKLDYVKGIFGGEFKILRV